MFVCKLPYIVFRAYPNNGYLTDNRNFGYDTASKSRLKVGDMVLSKEGSVFYSILEDRCLPFDLIVNKLLTIFSNVEYDTLYRDALLFYNELAEKGFVLCTDDECDTRDLIYFSYSNSTPFILSDTHQNTTSDDFVLNESFNLSQVHIEISGACNENCVHCYIPSQMKCGIMTEDLFDKVLSECIKLKVLNITLSGGEPMLNPCLLSFLQKCGRNNFSINILSNLTQLSDELFDEIVSNPLISIQTSLYAMDEDVHDSITRQKGSFRKTINAITRLHEQNIPMQINCPIMKQNLHYYSDVIDFASSLNISHSIDYALFCSYDSSCSNIACRINTTEIADILKISYSDVETLNEAIQSSLHKQVDDGDFICSVCKSSLCISHNGDVYPCEGWQRMVLGNVNSHSLSEIWEEAPVTKRLRELRFQDFKKCSICQNRMYCSPCLIMNANESVTNDYMNINPYLCDMAEIKRNAIELARRKS